MDGSLVEKERNKIWNNVRVMRIFLHIHISFGHEFIWTIHFGKIKLIKK